MLYNIWHGFLVHSWWPCVLWQAVTLWLVNSSVIRALRYNRSVTEMRWHDENHAMRFRQKAENRSRMSSQGGASIGTPLLLEEDMGRRSPLAEYMSLHPSLTHHRNINSFENKVREIYFYKEGVHSFIEVHKLCLIMFPLIFVCGYTALSPGYELGLLYPFPITIISILHTLHL